MVAADWTEARLCMISAMASWREWVLLDFISSGVMTGRAAGSAFISEYSEMILYSAAIIRSSLDPLPAADFTLPPIRLTGDPSGLVLGPLPSSDLGLPSPWWLAPEGVLAPDREEGG